MWNEEVLKQWDAATDDERFQWLKRGWDLVQYPFGRAMPEAAQWHRTRCRACQAFPDHGQGCAEFYILWGFHLATYGVYDPQGVQRRMRLPRGALCGLCHQDTVIDFGVRSDVWMAVVGHDDYLCLWCFDRLAIEKGITYEFYLTPNVRAGLDLPFSTWHERALNSAGDSDDEPRVVRRVRPGSETDEGGVPA